MIVGGPIKGHLFTTTEKVPVAVAPVESRIVSVTECVLTGTLALTLIVT